MSYKVILFVVLMISTYMTLLISFLSWPNRKQPAARICALIMLAASFYSFGYAFEIASRTTDQVVFWLKVEYAGIPFISALWLILILQYTGNKALLHKRVYFLLMAVPVVTLIMHYTNDTHHWFYREIALGKLAGITTVTTVKGPWYWVHTAYSYLCTLAGIVVSAALYLKAAPLIRKQIIVMMVGAAVPWIANMLYLTGSISANLDLEPFSFMVSGVIYFFGIYRLNILRLSSLAMEQVFESMADGVVILDLEYNITNFNEAAQGIFEQLGPIRDKPAPALQVFAAYPAIVAKLAESSNSESQLSFSRNGVTKHYDFSVSMIYGKGRTLLGKTLLFHETTEVVNNQEKLLTIARQLADMNAFKDQLFSVLAHDIRDPLAVLINLTELLEEEIQSLASENLEIFREVKEQIAGTYELVEHLLEWFRNQKRKIAFNPSAWDLSSFVQQAIQTVKVHCEIKKIEIVSYIDDGFAVFADKEMVGIILRNLLANAIKFTAIGGYVRIRAAYKEDWIVVSVQDSGGGIDPAIAKSLLQDSQPVNMTMEKGSGFGLVLCKELVGIHGGSIWFESAPGQGSTFFFTLQANEKAEKYPIREQRELEPA
ncbi:hypothetical protein SD70_07570 [Gordoniibacillus kamchatkensis]|uniref:histidine kinase n=1 Tax=Gordoniibacillus kamchatkensis TaxID=1590651 RepID=A0ABR5ALS5_9BACL|nr:histidine kinase N-terminal 7TM domain-containing protein [Paenibacillus sp. VKM B-2647]KIL41307.1 hypothetical protein SD70_07570 [Paenibacillus sp. VKM B-2647]